VDTITHGIAGALLAKAFVSEGEGRVAAMAVTVGSVFPDSDTFVNFFYRDRIAFLEIHRGITHSLVALPAFALLLGGLTTLWIGQRRKWLLFSGLFGIGIGLHILMDVITSFGTMVWLPLNRTRVTWDMVFIIDVVLTSIVLLPQLTAWVYSDRERARQRGYGVWLCMTLAGIAVAWLASWQQVPVSGRTVATASALIAAVLWLPSLGGRGFQWPRSKYCRVGVAALAIYLGLCAIAHQAALRRVEEYAKLSGVTVERLAALPAPPSLLRWYGLVQSPQGIYRGSINLTDFSLAAYRFFPNAEDNRYLQTAESLADAKVFLWFARFPWVTYQQLGNLHVVEIRDVQFFLPSRGERSTFTFRVSLDSQGHILSSDLLRP
jgi:membrane-bound metal-dependent hydrolase YbcI (DUF457 family)